MSKIGTTVELKWLGTHIAHSFAYLSLQHLLHNNS